MIILGIDPGIATIGYGVIKENKHKIEMIDYGCILTKSCDNFHVRLNDIFKDVRKLLKNFNPDIVVCEEIFFYKNAKTAINVGHARGVIMLALIKSNVEIIEYTPLHVKQVITGYGRADKKEMQSKIKKILKLKDIPKPDDAADALAIAICHIHKRKWDSKPKKQQKVTSKKKLS